MEHCFIYRKEKRYSKISIGSVCQSPVASGSLLITDSGQRTACILLCCWPRPYSLPAGWGWGADILLGQARCYRKHMHKQSEEAYCLPSAGENPSRKIFFLGRIWGKQQLSTQLPFREMFQGQGTYWKIPGVQAIRHMMVTSPVVF